MKNKTIVIYHSADFDGVFCREIAKKFLADAELIGWNYGDEIIPFPKEGTVYVLDLSPDCLSGLTVEVVNDHRLIWIDHHKSAIDKYSKYNPELPGYRIDGVAACRLAWQWFFVSQHNAQNQTNEQMQVDLPTKQQFVDRVVPEPMAVRLAGEYDIWDKRDPDAELFQHGLRSQDLSERDWGMLLSMDVEPCLQGTGMEYDNSALIVAHLLRSGRGIQYARTKENESIIKDLGFTFQWEGMTWLACNHARYNSHLFTAGLTPEHDACFGFKYRGGQWEVSLYHAPGKEHHDLSLIAVKYGGGGHRGACGFRIKQLPFMA